MTGCTPTRSREPGSGERMEARAVSFSRVTLDGCFSLVALTTCCNQEPGGRSVALWTAERSRRTVVREVREELGIHVNATDLYLCYVFHDTKSHFVYYN